MIEEGNSEYRQSLIFEIYLTNKNKPNGNIEFDLDNKTNKSDWTEYPSEEEVLILPFFKFQVVKTT